MHAEQLENLEISLLLEGIKRRYGYDFGHYSYASLKRRLTNSLRESGLPDFVQLLARILHDEVFFDRVLQQISITVTEMFRDPDFYKEVRNKIIPLFKTFPFVKIWHAGCATGEEAYSMAVMLHEEGFLDRAQIYATDFNSRALNTAQKGIYPAGNLKKIELNYTSSGGNKDFSEYYTKKYEFIKFKDFLSKRITFSYHNLITDGVFGEMNMVCCRNVLIYFDKELQNRVLCLFAESLRHNGILCLGNKESINFSDAKMLFQEFDKKQRIFKKHGTDSKK